MEWLIAAILLAACCGLTICNPFIQATMFGADQLTIPAFIEDLLRNPLFSPFTWNVPQAPYAFPDAGVFLLLRLITGDPYVAVILHAVSQGVVIAIAARLIFARALADEARSGAAFIVFLALTATLLALSTRVAAGHMLTWLYVPIAHGTAAITALLVFGLHEAFFHRRNIALHGLLLAITTLAIFSDRFFIAYFSLPYAVVLIFAADTSPGARGKALLRVVLFAAETLVALVLADWLATFFVQQGSSVGFRIIERVRAILAVMSSDGLWPWAIWGVGVATALPLYWIAALPSSALAMPPRQRRARIFVGAFTLFAFALTVFLWHSAGTAYSRYAVGLYLGTLLAVSIVLSDQLSNRRRARWAIAGLCALAAFSLAWSIAGTSYLNPSAPLTKRRDLAGAMDDCRHRFGLKDGLASYGPARAISMATGFRVHVLQLDERRPLLHFWGSDYLWFFFEPVTARPVDVNFIVVEARNLEAIRSLYGEPARTADCGPFKLFLYPDRNLADVALKLSAVPAWAFALAGHLPATMPGLDREGGVVFDLPLLGRPIGRTTPGDATARAPADAADYLLLGPTFVLPRGRYSLDAVLRCDASSVANRLDVTTDVAKTMLASKQADPNAVCDGRDHDISLPFQLARRMVGVDLGVFFGGSGTLTVSSLRLRREPGAD